MTDLPMTKADDELLELLRTKCGGCEGICEDAADEITSLRAQLAAAEAALATAEKLAREDTETKKRFYEDIRAAESQLQAMRKALEENEEYWKSVHDLIESARETVRLKIVYNKRPPGLFQDLQNAVYICRGRNVEALRSLTEGAGK